MRTTRFAFAFLTTLAVGGGLAGCGPNYPNCDNDEDCHEGEYCVNGMCQQCRTDADCPSGQQCADGRCDDIEGFCESANDCPDGQECENNRCVEPVESTTDLGTGDTGDGSCTIEAVYFEFDSANLRSSARNQIQSNVDCMREKDISKLHLTGHTDPRGTEEYNLALGDRRARSVRDYMSDLGMDESDVTVSSMGEEMATGTDEQGWSTDRRVEFETQ
ncbi:MAG: OmpA family protein [Myxococcota bacterium]